MENRFLSRVWKIETQTMHYFEAEIEYLYMHLDIYPDGWELLSGTRMIACSENKDVKMQCTGLRDKNNKLIYESDILDYREYGTKAAITWDNKHSGYLFGEDRLNKDDS